MIKIIKYETGYASTEVVATCYADEKTDVTDQAIEDLGLSAGSMIYTKALDIGVVDSDGSVNWSE